MAPFFNMFLQDYLWVISTSQGLVFPLINNLEEAKNILSELDFSNRTNAYLERGKDVTFMIGLSETRKKYFLFSSLNKPYWSDRGLYDSIDKVIKCISLTVRHEY